MSVIRKLIAYLLLILSVFTSPKPDKLLISAVSVSPEAVIAECENQTGRRLLLDGSFFVEKKENDKWEKLEFCDSFPGFEETVAELLPSEKIRIKIDTAQCFGKELESGAYRVTVSAYMTGCGEITASAEFVID